MENLIRKIVIGPNPKDAMAYYVGMKAGAGKVVLIEEDDRAMFKHKIRRYNIYTQDTESSYLWKTVENTPVIVEYDCNFE